MADAKITELTELTGVATTDILPIVDDPAGTPVTKKATVANVVAAVIGTITSFGQSLIDDADAATARATLGLVIGTNVQAFDADLTTIAGLTATTDNFMQAKASAWASRTPAQVLADLAAVGTTFQPLDSDLTAIAALTTTAYGRALLELANQAALVTALGLVHTINIIIDGGGAVIATGVKPDVKVDFACTVTEWTILGDQSGSIVVDLWKDTYANYPPTVADTMTGAEKPTISADTKGQDTSLNGGAGWAIAAGSIIRPNVDSVTSLTRVTLALKVTRT